MGKKSTQFIDEKGNKCQFYSKGLRAARAYYKVKHNISLSEIDEMLADNLHVSVESIKNYVKGYNGPSDLEMVKQMAVLLECEFNELLEVSKEYVREAIKNIPDQPKFNFYEPRCESDVIDIVYRRLLYLAQHSSETDNFMSIPGMEKPKPIYSVAFGKRVVDSEKTLAGVSAYYGKFLLDTKKVIDDNYIFISERTNKILTTFLKDIYPFLCCEAQAGEMGRGFPITTYSDVFPEYELIFNMFQVDDDDFEGKFVDAYGYELYGLADSDDVNPIPRDKLDDDMGDLIFRGIERFYNPNINDYMDWAATVAVKKLFKEKFPEYFGGNKNDKKK